MTLWNREPTMILGFIQAAIALITSFGLQMSEQQVAAIIAFAAAALALATAGITRSQVTSPATVEKKDVQIAGLIARVESAGGETRKEDYS